MGTLIWVVAAVALLVLATLFFLMRKFGLERIVGAGKKEEESTASADVEFEWTARPPLLGTLIVALVVIAAVAIAYIYGEEEGLNKGIMQMIVGVVGMLAALLGTRWQTCTYQLTSDGLYSVERSGKKQRKMVFAWPHLLWFKPGNHGFKYYLKKGAGASPPAAGARSSGRIPCSKDATLVNSMLLARGIPTSPPPKSGL